MPLLWIPFRMIFSINVGIGNAGAGAGMFGAVRHASSSNFTTLSFSSAMQRQLAGEPTGLQTTFALSAVLIAQNPKLPLLVPTQSVWAQEPTPLVVHSGYRMSAFYCRPNQTVDVFHRLDRLRRRTHAFRVLRPAASPKR